MRDVTKKPENVEVVGADGADRERRSTRRPVESLHPFEHRALGFGRELSALPRSGEYSVSNRLGENEHIAWSSTRVGEKKIRMRSPSYREPVFELGIHDSV